MKTTVIYDYVPYEPAATLKGRRPRSSVWLYCLNRQQLEAKSLDAQEDDLVTALATVLNALQVI